MLLFLGSVFTTAASGARLRWNFDRGLPALAGGDDFLPLIWIWHHLSALASGLSFSFTLLSILLAHEAGHLLYCRKHNILGSWPYVVPAPTLSGTLGAVIRIRSRIPSSRALMEVGIAGPIAGYLVALPATVVGLLLSRPMPSGASTAPLQFEQPFTVSLLDGVVRLLIPSVPSIPHLLPHPVLIASWIGLFITSLNLIPAGQLDGGHILYALSPKWHRIMTIAVPLVLAGMGVMLWAGWLIWAAVLLLPVMRHPRISQAFTLPPRHRWLGWLALALFALTVLPQPFAGTGLLQILR